MAERLVIGGQEVTVFESGPADAKALLFIHGWTSDHTTFREQIPAFSKDYRCLSLDLPGHGQSGAPADHFTLPWVADVIQAVLTERNCMHPVVIGHSMGGLIATELATRGVVAGAVLLDPAMIVRWEKLEASLLASQSAMREGGLRRVQQRFRDTVMFEPGDPDSLKAEIAEIATRCAEPVALQAWDAMINWKGEARLAEVTCPILCLVADRPQNRYADMRRHCSHLRWGQTVGAGHFHHLIVADQVNAMIRRFLDVEGLAN